MLGERRDLERFIQNHTCLACGPEALLVVRWNREQSSHQVYCPKCGNTEHFAKPRSLTEMWKEDPGSVPITVANRLEAKYGGEAMSEKAIVVATERQMTERIGQARWLHELAPEDRTTLAHLAVQYGLDPVMGELIIYENKPYITLAGMIRQAHRQPEFEGLEDRPMTTEERTAYGIKQPIAWLTTIYRRGWKVPVKGIGTADPADPLRANPIERKNPQIVARSRSIRQALRTGFPHSLPWSEVRTAGEDVDTMDAEVRVIDTETGEITSEPASSNGHTEATVSEAVPEQPAETAAASPAPEATVQPANPTPASNKRADPNGPAMKDWQRLYRDAEQFHIETGTLAGSATDQDVLAAVALLRARIVKAGNEELAQAAEMGVEVKPIDVKGWKSYGDLIESWQSVRDS